jgi:hypothetical protein
MIKGNNKSWRRIAGRPSGKAWSRPELRSW